MTGDRDPSAVSPAFHLAAAAMTVAAMVAAAVALSISGVVDLRDSSVAAGDVASTASSVPTTSGESPPPHSSDGGPVTDTTAPEQVSLGPVLTTVTAASSTSGATSTGPTTPAEPVTSIRTVPAVRDLIVRVGDLMLATDADGVLELGPVDQGTTIEILGVSATPSIEEVRLSQWSDGIASPARLLDDAPGPELVVGLDIRHRIVVLLDASAPDLETVAFESPQVGRIELPVDEASWVVASRAVEVGGEFVAEDVVYQIDATRGDVVDATYLPRPESIWSVSGR